MSQLSRTAPSSAPVHLDTALQRPLRLAADLPVKTAERQRHARDEPERGHVIAGAGTHRAFLVAVQCHFHAVAARQAGVELTPRRTDAGQTQLAGFGSDPQRCASIPDLSLPVPRRPVARSARSGRLVSPVE